jgi:hypothetical protein
MCKRFKGPYRPDAIRQRDANFQFSMTFNFTIFLCFSNIRNHLSNFNYLVCISCKIFNRSQFYLFLKTENSRRVAESRSVCVGLKCKQSNIHLFQWCEAFQWYEGRGGGGGRQPRTQERPWERGWGRDSWKNCVSKLEQNFSTMNTLAW